MRHSADRAFWNYYRELPADVRVRADRCFKTLLLAPNHPSLRFKRIGKLWSVRVGLDYRALGRESNTRIVWFWIGSHAAYDKLISGSGSDSLREAFGAWIVNPGIIKVVAWSDEDQCYVGIAPDLLLGGCHGADEKAVFEELCTVVEETVAVFQAQP